MRTGLAWLFAVATAMSFLSSPSGAEQSLGVTKPRKIKDVAPVYPEQSLAAGDEGVVVADLEVDASGAVAAARVLWSKCPALNESALKATRSWLFEQVRVNGEAKPFTAIAYVPFRLPEKLKSRAGRPGACRWIDPPKPLF